MNTALIRCQQPGTSDEIRMGNSEECQPCAIHRKSQGFMKAMLSQNLPDEETDILRCWWQASTNLKNMDNPSCTVTSLERACASFGTELVNHLIIQCPEIFVWNIMQHSRDILSPLELLSLEDDFDSFKGNITHFEIQFDVDVSGLGNIFKFHNTTGLTISGCRITFKTISEIIIQLNLNKLRELHLDMIEYPPSPLQQINNENFSAFENITSLNITYGQWNDSYNSHGWDNIFSSMPRLSQLIVIFSSSMCWIDTESSQHSFTQNIGTAKALTDILKIPKLLEVEVFMILPMCENWNLSHLSLRSLSTFHFGGNGNGRMHTLNVSHNALNVLDIYYNNAPIQIFDVSYNHIKSLEKSWLHGLGKLKEIRLSHNAINSINLPYFRHLSSLEILQLDHNEISYLTNYSFQGLGALLEIDLGHNKLDSILLSFFISNPKLQKLLLNNNLFKTVDHFPFSIPLSVNYLDLSSNPLQISEFKDIARSHIKIDNLEKYGVNPAMPNQSDIVLEKLLDNYERDSRMYAWYMCNDKELDWLPDRGSVCSVHQKIILYNAAVTRNHLGLDFLLTSTHNPLLPYSSVLSVLNHVSVDIGENQLECGCKDILSYFILNMLYEENELTNNFYRTNWICTLPEDVAGMPYLQVPQRVFKGCTENLPNCPDKCVCYHDVHKMDRITVDCTGEYLNELPTIVPKGTEALYVPNTNITSLCTDIEQSSVVFRQEYLGNLVELDVSGNHITEVCPEFVKALNVMKLDVLKLGNTDLQSLPKNIQSLEITTIFLAGNEFACSCENTWLKYWISNRQALVPDASSILCRNIEGSYFLGLDDTVLTTVCTDNTVHVSWLGLALGSTLTLFLVLVLMALLYRFRKRIKIWCFIKFRWHPFDQGDMDDNIESMDYDVFISYSHLDLTWVRENLMEFLQGNGYSVCLHEKDWPVGVLITENILLSVKHSRRMIMVLSQNYLSSEWCRVEFQVAHRAILEGRTKYLIMVALEDVALKNLPAEIDFYVKTHTFLEADNAWFQKRLMYAMPQKTLAEMRNENNGNDIELQDNNSNRRHFTPLFYRIFTYKDDDEEELVAQ